MEGTGGAGSRLEMTEGWGLGGEGGGLGEGGVVVGDIVPRTRSRPGRTHTR